MNLLKAYINEILPGGWMGSAYEEPLLEKRVRLLEERVRALESEREALQKVSGETPNA